MLTEKQWEIVRRASKSPRNDGVAGARELRRLLKCALRELMGEVMRLRGELESKDRYIRSLERDLHAACEPDLDGPMIDACEYDITVLFDGQTALV